MRFIDHNGFATAGPTHAVRMTHNPKVAGSNPAPATKGPGQGVAPARAVSRPRPSTGTSTG